MNWPKIGAAPGAPGEFTGKSKRATPGGYGGKPPGVAYIGAPTGARNAGTGAPPGDQSTGKHVTPKPPLARQDRITSGSRHGHPLILADQPFPGGARCRVCAFGEGAPLLPRHVLV